MTGKPLATPLFTRFRLQTGYVPQRNGWRRALVADVEQERYRKELDERLGTILQRHAEDPLPDRIVTFGKRPFCVQIPNPRRPEPVAWRADIPATIDRIPLGIAYDWTGQSPVWWDRTVDAHAMIAGFTGSGKSEMMRAILASLITHIRPQELEIVAIDMKGRSLSAFADAPHFRHAVAYEPGTAMSYLSAIDAEINSRVATGRNTPALCVAIDELSDLLEGDAQAQSWLARIAKMGRELGIFLITGTQKPLISEIGQAKSQFGLRLVGRMRSGKDAETAAGTNVDADSLYHPGSFFRVTGADTATLFRGLLVDSADIRRACEKWSQDGPSVLHMSVASTETVTGRDVLKAEKERSQAEQDAEVLQAEFGDDWQEKASGKGWKTKMIRVLTGEQNPGGGIFYSGEARLEKAMEVIG